MTVHLQQSFVILDTLPVLLSSLLSYDFRATVSVRPSKSFLLFYTKNQLFLFYTLIFTKHPYQSIYSIHLFNKIFILLQFCIISLLTTSLSHIPNTTQKNTKIINARVTVTVHICMVIVTIVHLCIILHLLMWIFFGSKCAYLNTFSILHYFTFTDASALIGLRCNRLYTNIDPWLCSAASVIYSLLQTTKQTQKKKKKPSHK